MRIPSGDRILFCHGARVACLAAVLLAGCGRAPKPEPVAPPVNPPPPSPVKVAAPVVIETPVIGEAVAKLAGSAETPVHAPMAGYLVKQAYEEGAQVKAGDVLFEIDAKAPSGLTKITSPIAGVAGRATPGVGDLVTPDMTLTTVAAIDPIEAQFAVPAPFYREHADWLAKILAAPPADRPANIQLILADGSIYPAPGRLASIEEKIPATASVVTITASFSNPDGALRPGQYAKVRGVADPK